jgi:molecular chaperone GrpE
MIEQEENKNQEQHNQNGSEEPQQETATVEKSAEEKLAELNDKYMRLYAEFDNFRKRSAKERIELLKFAAEEIVRQLLPVLDDFERGFKSMTEVTDIAVLKQGQELIYNKFKNMLIQNGLQEMKVVGELFNPEFHDAITNVPAPSEDMKGKVVEEVEKGYYLNGKVIRHAKVIVGQ